MSDLYYAAFVLPAEVVSYQLVALESQEYDDAVLEGEEKWPDAWGECVVLDIGDLISLARFFGQYKRLFKSELGLSHVPDSWLG